MKTINWIILCVVVLFVGGWVFNNISAWLGVAIFIIEVYLIVLKLSSILKGVKNAK